MSDSRPTTFIERCVLGQAAPEQIDDYVARWHRAPRGRALHEFLGLTGDEYARWVEDPDSLAGIVANRKGRAKPAARARG